MEINKDNINEFLSENKTIFLTNTEKLNEFDTYSLRYHKNILLQIGRSYLSDNMTEICSEFRIPPGEDNHRTSPFVISIIFNVDVSDKGVLEKICINMGAINSDMKESEVLKCMFNNIPYEITSKYWEDVRIERKSLIRKKEDGNLFEYKFELMELDDLNILVEDED